MPPESPPAIDKILEAIRAEARARGSRDRVGGFSHALPEGAGLGFATFGTPQPAARHVGDLLSLPLDVFIATAYRELLGREPDAAGATHYQRLMLRGSMCRAEVLGRLAFSPEGRRRGGRLPGIVPAFLLALAYRIPLAGPVVGIAARALRLPAHWQDRSALEHAALATGSWMKR